jgi:hypothetical protein
MSYQLRIKPWQRSPGWPRERLRRRLKTTPSGGWAALRSMHPSFRKHYLAGWKLDLLREFIARHA